MTNLNNFNNFELSTEETTNVNGGRCSRRRRSCGDSYSSSSCSKSYSSCSYNDCESTVEVAPVVEIIEVAPVVETSASQNLRGVAGA